MTGHKLMDIHVFLDSPTLVIFGLLSSPRQFLTEVLLASPCYSKDAPNRQSVNLIDERFLPYYDVTDPSEG